MKKNIKTNYIRLYPEEDLKILVWLLQNYLHCAALLTPGSITGRKEDADRLRNEGLIDWFQKGKTTQYHIHLTEFGKEIAINYAKYTGVDFKEYDLKRVYM